MADEGFKRKLAAILSADAVGYSRLMGDDEEATVKTLRAYREVLGSLIQQHNGKVLDSPGDNLLAEFVSVVDAVQCGVAVQKEIKARNDNLPEDRRMQFRIGINLGDVIQEEGQIYGDGVNIAARLEGLAEPGGICISKTAFDHIESKLPYGYDFLGDQSVKNIAKPVGAYRVLMDPRVTASGKPIGEKNPVKMRNSYPLWAAAAILIVAGLLIWQYSVNRVSVETASLYKMAFSLQDKPSIAVLPFDNLSDDSEQEYFADGLTDDLITALSKISGIFVISRNSVFSFKDKPVKIQDVAKELGVHYVLEGSIRRAGDTVRVNAQLIDAETDHHLWAEKYDGRIEDIFSLQDNITRKIVSALSVNLTNKEQGQFSTTETNNIQAYDLLLKAKALAWQNSPDSYVAAAKLLKQALELDPDYSRAYAELADLWWWGASQGVPFWKKMNITYQSGRNLAISFLEPAMGNPTSKAHQIAALVAMARRQFVTAAEEAEKAIVLSPNDSEGYAALSMIYADTQPEKAIAYAEIVAKLDPRNISGYLYRQGVAHFFMKNFEKTVEIMERAAIHSPSIKNGNAFLAAAYAHLGKQNKANRIYNDFYLKAFEGLGEPMPEHIIHHYGIQKPEMADHLISGLIKAGLPARFGNYCRLSDEERLSIEEVKDLVYGKTWTGSLRGPSNYKWSNHFSKNGINTLKYLYFSIKREYGFEDDKFYIMKSAGGRKIKSYQKIYRNPHGSSKKMGEYIVLNESFVGPFSVHDSSQ